MTLGLFLLILTELAILAGLAWCLHRVNILQKTLTSEKTTWLLVCQQNRKQFSSLSRNSNDWHHTVQAAGLMLLKKTGWVGLIAKYCLKKHPS